MSQPQLSLHFSHSEKCWGEQIGGGMVVGEAEKEKSCIF